MLGKLRCDGDYSSGSIRAGELNTMISVVIPALNEEKLIARCLESLQKQDYSEPFEIIVVDNGSLDGTVQIARGLGVRVVDCPKKGVALARQCGADAARGDIIVQADADTIYPIWWLSRIQFQFRRRPAAVAVAGTFIYIKPPWWARIEYFLRVFFGILSSVVFGHPLVISGANLAFYKRALVRIGGYQPGSYSADQINIATRLSTVGKVVYDGRLWCATSDRSVTKPVFSILIAFIGHISRFSGYVFASLGALFNRRKKRRFSLSTGTYIKIAIPAIIISVLCYGYFVPASPVFGKVYSRSVTTNKVIALTFDDGPNEPYTSQVLDVLKQYDIQATFFVVGYNVKLYPETVKRIVDEGSVVGDHSYYHNANHALKFNGDKDILLAEQAIYDATGLKPHLYRPPHGKKSPWELDAIKHDGFVEVVWNISTNELSGRSPQFLAEQIIKKASPGGIILMHDGYGTIHNAPRADKSKTVAMLPLIIERLEAEGYTFVTVPDLLHIPAYNRTDE
jgi:peptidoglycan-N-acetylglucosamine deacetylase